MNLQEIREKAKERLAEIDAEASVLRLILNDEQANVAVLPSPPLNLTSIRYPRVPLLGDLPTYSIMTDDSFTYCYTPRNI